MTFGATIARSATFSERCAIWLRLRSSWPWCEPAAPCATMRVKCTDTRAGASAIISTSTVGLPGGTRKPMRTGRARGSGCSGSTSLFGADALLADDPAPARVLRADEGAELRRRAADRLRAQRREALAHFRQAQRLAHLGLQPHHDLGRRAGDAEESLPADHLVTRHARLRHRRQRRLERRALRARDRERAQLAAAHEGHRARHVLDHEREL